MIEDFSGTPASKWEFITDQVIGGVSTGRVSLEGDAGQTMLHLQGAVSTANNGGFIQARQKLANRLPETAQGLELKVKGNGQIYYRSTPAHAEPFCRGNFYQASFAVTPEWTVVHIPFGNFKAQGRSLGKTLVAEAVKSFAIVAFGRDHNADVWVASMGCY